MKGREKFLKAVLCLLVVVPAAFGTAASGAILNVPSDDHPTIQAALDVAAVGDEVLVADGTYTGSGNVNLVVDQKITIRSQNGPNLCIIDCQGNGRAFTFTGADTEGAVLRGFTIRGGNVVDRGGAILSQNLAKPTIDDCIITGNAAKASVGIVGFGGGIACVNSSPIINNCHIEGNSAGYGGGGLFCIGSSPIITRCTITKNNGGDFGGGVYMVSKSSPSISSCMVTGNSANLKGGGFYCYLTSSPSITNCTVADNSTSNAASTEGGGMYLSSLSPSHDHQCNLLGQYCRQGARNLCAVKLYPTSQLQQFQRGPG